MGQQTIIQNLPQEMQGQEFAPLPKGCERFGFSRSTAYRAFKNGDLTKYKLGSAVYLDLAEVRRWITGKAEKAA